MNIDPYFLALQKKGLVLDCASPEDIKKRYEETHGNAPYLGWVPMLCVLAEDARKAKNIAPEKKPTIQEVIDRARKDDKI